MSSVKHVRAQHHFQICVASSVSAYWDEGREEYHQQEVIRNLKEAAAIYGFTLTPKPVVTRKLKTLDDMLQEESERIANLPLGEPLTKLTPDQARDLGLIPEWEGR
jgi:hypothetical protein